MSRHVSISAQMRPYELKTQDVAQRWAVLAERRLSYLTELYDSGRWRRFHNEADFLDNIAEAKSAVERWQAMANGEYVAPVIREAPVMRAAPAVEAPVVPAIIAAIMEDVVAEPQHEAEIVSFEDYAGARAQHAVEERTEEVASAPAPLDLFDRDALIARYPMLRAAM